jgi:hypothetical protein
MIKGLGHRQIGVTDKRGNDICEGYVIEHNGNRYFVKYSNTQHQFVARASEGMNWRRFDWIKNLGDKYITIVGNAHFDRALFEEFKEILPDHLEFTD